jgi:dUTP pyrophosphatase
MALNLKLKQAEASKANLEDILPTYGSDKAAAFDLRADLEGRVIKGFSPEMEEPYPKHSTFNCVVILPEERVLIPTGFVFGIPEGFQMNIYSRSGLTWKNGVIVLNAPAVIDEDYSDETFVILYNSSSEPFTIEHGMRIAQAQLNVVNQVDLESLGSRTGGFGSTNLK